MKTLLMNLFSTCFQNHTIMSTIGKVSSAEAFQLIHLSGPGRVKIDVKFFIVQVVIFL